MVNENVSEEALMLAYAGGDQCAFERLFASLAPRLHARAQVRPERRPGEEAQDVLDRLAL